jgi:glutathione peroxidase
MKKSVLGIFLILVAFGACKKDTGTKQNAEVLKEEIKNQVTENIYQFQVNDLYGEAFDFSNLKGKKVMVVNTASECGLTPQYAELQKLYDTYKDQNFVIVGFPANNFGGQEPGTDMEIATFCKENYGVTFPMMSKISVKGSDMHEVYHFLTEKNKNGFQDSEVSWNFQKYLLNEKGELAMVIAPRTLPTDPKIVAWIESK